MRVILSHQAKKQYDNLPLPQQKKVKKKLLSLEEYPQSGKKLSGELNQFRSLRAWPYRIIYAVNEKDNRLEVVDIEHRQSAYRK